jgi:peptide deformylase
MFDVMYKAPGIGLAATQIGVQRQVFVYDIEEERKVILNPQIVESSGEWVYDEGCLSIPGLYVEMLRPKRILVRGINLDGNQVEFEADELLARLFQHEVDHLNGVLMFDRMTPDQRREAVTLYRAREGQSKDSEPYHLKLV